MLAKYNIMGLGLGLGVAAMAQMRQAGDGGGIDTNKCDFSQFLKLTFRSMVEFVFIFS